MCKTHEFVIAVIILMVLHAPLFPEQHDTLPNMCLDF